MLSDVLRTLEVLDVTDLVDLIKADGLNSEHRLDLLEVSLSRREYCNSRTGERDLRGGRKVENSVLRTVLETLGENIYQLVSALGVKLVDCVRVIPENSEIGCRDLHLCKTVYRLGRVGISVGIGIFRTTPHTLNCRVYRNESFDLVHIGARGEHRHIDHLDTERLTDREVAVVSGCGTDELHLLKLRPGAFTADHAVKHSACDRVVHKIERGVSADKDISFGNAEKVGKKSLCLGNSVKHAVIAAIYAVLCRAILCTRDAIEHSRHKIKLSSARLSSREIEREAFSLQSFIFFLKLCFK